MVVPATATAIVVVVIVVVVIVVVGTRLCLKRRPQTRTPLVVVQDRRKFPLFAGGMGL